MLEPFLWRHRLRHQEATQRPLASPRRENPLRNWLLVVALLVPISAVLVGCGGDGSGPAPPPGNSGQIAGRVAGVANAADYTITVDGRPVQVRPGANGSFTIPGVPPGAHTIGCVGPGGMQGGYVAVRVRRGQTANAGEISPELGGQIAGIVTRWLSGGTLEPVPQMEVVATPDPNVWIENPPDEPVPIGRGATGTTDDGIVISTFTDDNGSYIMKAVPPGSYSVSVIVPGDEANMQFVWVEAGRTSAADFTLYPAPEEGVGTVEGTVTGEGEGPLEGAQVTLTTGEPWIVPLPAGALAALAQSRLDAGLLSPLQRSDPGGGNDPGDPTDPGVPVEPPWFEVRVFSTLSDQDGRYSLNVPVGTQWIECWMDGWEWQGENIVIEKHTTTTKDFVLEKWDEPIPWPCPSNDPNCPVASR